jgi:hypothetical protein
MTDIQRASNPTSYKLMASMASTEFVMRPEVTYNSACESEGVTSSAHLLGYFRTCRGAGYWRRGLHSLFLTHGLPGASVAGVSVTGQTKSQLAAELGERADQVSVTLQIDDHSRELSLADLGISVDAQATADHVFAANENLGQRYSAVFTKQTSPVVATVDESKIDALTAELVSEYVIPPRTRSSSSAMTTHRSSSSPPGRYRRGRLRPDRRSGPGVQTLSSQTVRLTTSQVDPHTSTDQAQTVADKANKLVALDVNLTGRESDSYRPLPLRRRSGSPSPPPRTARSANRSSVRRRSPRGFSRQLTPPG